MLAERLPGTPSADIWAMRIDQAMVYFAAISRLAERRAKATSSVSSRRSGRPGQTVETGGLDMLKSMMR